MRLEKKKVDYLFRVSSFLVLSAIVFDDVVTYLSQIAGVVVIATCILNIIYQYHYAKRGMKYTVDMIFDIGVICLSIYMIVS